MAQEVVGSAAVGSVALVGAGWEGAARAARGLAEVGSVGAGSGVVMGMEAVGWAAAGSGVDWAVQGSGVVVMGALDWVEVGWALEGVMGALDSEAGLVGLVEAGLDAVGVVGLDWVAGLEARVASVAGAAAGWAALVPVGMGLEEGGRVEMVGLGAVGSEAEVGLVELDWVEVVMGARGWAGAGSAVEEAGAGSDTQAH